MRALPTTTVLLLLVTFVSSCIGASPAKLDVVQALPRSEVDTTFAILPSEDPDASEIAELNEKLADRVHYELLRNHAIVVDRSTADRTVIVKVVDHRNINEWSRAMFGVFAGPEWMCADVQVVEGDPPAEVGRAGVRFEQGVEYLPTHTNVTLGIAQIAEATVEFLLSRAPGRAPLGSEATVNDRASE